MFSSKKRIDYNEVHKYFNFQLMIVIRIMTVYSKTQNVAMIIFRVVAVTS